jgi:hypothetical protein
VCSSLAPLWLSVSNLHRYWWLSVCGKSSYMCVWTGLNRLRCDPVMVHFEFRTLMPWCHLRFECSGYLQYGAVSLWECLSAVITSRCVYLHVPVFLPDWRIPRIIACNETNLMHCLSSVYSVTAPLHVSGLLVVHHQEVTMYICGNWYVLYGLVNCRLAYPNQASRQLTKPYNTYQLPHIYIVTSWWFTTIKPETCRGVVTE